MCKESWQKKSAENFENFRNFEIPKNLKFKILDFPGFLIWKFGNFVIQSPKAGPAPRVNLVFCLKMMNLDGYDI